MKGHFTIKSLLLALTFCAIGFGLQAQKPVASVNIGGASSTLWAENVSTNNGVTGTTGWDCRGEYAGHCALAHHDNGRDGAVTLNYSLDVTEAGTYTIRTYFKTAWGDRNEVSLTMNGTSLKTLNGATGAGGNWVVTNNTYEDVTGVELCEGANAFSVYLPSGGWEVLRYEFIRTGDAPNCKPACANPEPIITAIPDYTSVALNFTLPAGATDYILYRSLSADDRGEEVTGYTPGTTFNDTGLAEGTTYYYTLVADFADCDTEYTLRAKTLAHVIIPTSYTPETTATCNACSDKVLVGYTTFLAAEGERKDLNGGIYYGGYATEEFSTSFTAQNAGAVGNGQYTIVNNPSEIGGATSTPNPINGIFIAGVNNNQFASYKITGLNEYQEADAAISTYCIRVRVRNASGGACDNSGDLQMQLRNLNNGSISGGGWNGGAWERVDNTACTAQGTTGSWDGNNASYALRSNGYIATYEGSVRVGQAARGDDGFIIGFNFTSTDLIGIESIEVWGCLPKELEILENGSLATDNLLCENSPFTLRASGAGFGTNVQWFGGATQQAAINAANAGTNPLATSATYNATAQATNAGATTSYFYVAKGTLGQEVVEIRSEFCGEIELNGAVTENGEFCESTSFTLTATGASFEDGVQWFSGATEAEALASATALASAGNTLTRTSPTIDTEGAVIWYVAKTASGGYKSIKITSIRCCDVLVFSEYFPMDTANQTICDDTAISPLRPGSGGSTNYNWTGNDNTCNLWENEYAIATNSHWSYWSDRQQVNEHTGTAGSGAFMVNADNDQNATSRYFYELRLDGLCSEIEYVQLSAWYVSLANGGEQPSNILFEVWEADENWTPIGTAAIANNQTENFGGTSGGSFGWRRHQLEFATPAGSDENTRYILRLKNNSNQKNGNDLMIDDIEVKVCMPVIQSLVNAFEIDAVYCQPGETVADLTLPADEIPESLGWVLWQYRLDTAAEWTNIRSLTRPAGLNIQYGENGYFRAIIASNEANANTIATSLKNNTPVPDLGGCNYYIISKEALLECCTLPEVNVTSSGNIITESNINLTCLNVTGITLTATENAEEYIGGYEWYKDGALIAGETDNEIFVTVPGSYRVVALGKNLPSGSRCRTETTITVTDIRVTPDVTDSPDEVCVGGTITLVAKDPDTDATLTGTWSGGSDTTASINSATGVVTGKAESTVTFTFTETASGCTQDVTVTVHPLPMVTLTPVADFCKGTLNETAFTNSIANPAGHTITWVTKPNFTDLNNANGEQSFEYSITNAAGCTTTDLFYTVEVFTLPDAPTQDGEAATLSYCVDEIADIETDANLALNGTGASAGTGLKWYTGATYATAIAMDEPPTTHSGDEGTTIYYVKQTNATDCESSTYATVTVVVYSLPNRPANMGTIPLTYCQNDGTKNILEDAEDVTDGLAAAPGNTLQWYTSTDFTQTPIAAPTAFSTATSGTTIYYVTQKVGGKCESTEYVTINVTVNPAPTETLTDLSFCESFVPTLNLNLGTGREVIWTGIEPTATILEGLDASNTAYTYKYKVRNTTTGCESAEHTFSVTVWAQPDEPTIGTTREFTYCVGELANVVSDAKIGFNQDLVWYEDTNRTIESGLDFTQFPTTTPSARKAYYVTQQERTNSCESSVLLEVFVTVYDLPESPSVSKEITLDDFCETPSGTANIVDLADFTIATGNSLVWYTDAAGNNLVADIDFTAYDIDTAGENVYYAGQKNPTTDCVSAELVQVNIIVKATPDAPTTSGYNGCPIPGATDGSWDALITGNRANLQWYNSEGTLINTPEDFSKNPAEDYNQSYWVTQTVDGCESAKTEVRVTITTLPQAPRVEDYIECPTTEMLDLTSLVNASQQWYDGPNTATANKIAPPAPIDKSKPYKGTYYVTENNGCETAVKTVQVEIYESPTVEITTDLSAEVCKNTDAIPVTAAASGGNSDSYTYTWTGATPTTTGAATANVSITAACGATQTVSVYVTDDNSCPSTTATKTITIKNEKPVITWKNQAGFDGDLGCNPTLASMPDAEAVKALFTVTDDCAANPTVNVSPRGITKPSTCGREQIWDITYTGICQDADPTTVTYRWTEVAQPTIAINGTATETLPCKSPRPTATDAAVVAKFTVTDGCATNPVADIKAAGEPTNVGCVWSQVFNANYSAKCDNVAPADQKQVTFTWTEDEILPTFTIEPDSEDLALLCNPTLPTIASVKAMYAATDNCEGTVTITVTEKTAVLGEGCEKTQTFTVIAEDACGNKATAEPVFTWTEDKTPPTFGTIESQAATLTAAGTCAYTVPDLKTYIESIIQDGCSEATFVSQSPTAGTPISAETTVNVVIKDECGTTANANVTITIPAAPVFTVTNPNAMCEGGTYDLSGAISGQANVSDIKYYAGANETNELPSTMVTLNLPSPNVYYVVAKNADGCPLEKTISIPVKPTPVITDVTSSETCEGGTLTFTATSIPGATYTWTGVPNSATGNVLTIADAAGTYNVSVTATVDGCTSAAKEASYTVNENPTVTLDVPTEDICPDAGTIEVTAKAAGGDGDYNYIWTNADEDLADDSKATVSITETCATKPSISVQVIDGNTCQSTVVTKTISVNDTVLPVLTVPTDNLELPCNPKSEELPSVASVIAASSATDNCGTPTITAVAGAVIGNCEKSQTFTVTATDVCGNKDVETVTYTWTKTKTLEITTEAEDDKNWYCQPAAPAAPTFTVTDECATGTPVVTLTTLYETPQQTGCVYTQTWTANYKGICEDAEPVSITYIWTIADKPLITVSETFDGELPCNPTRPTVEDAKTFFKVIDNCSDEAAEATITAGELEKTGCSFSQTFTASYKGICEYADEKSITYEWTESEKPVINFTAPNTKLGCNPTLPTQTEVESLFSVTDACAVNPIAKVVAGTVEEDGCNRSQTWTATYEAVCGGAADEKEVTYEWKELSPITASEDGKATVSCDTDATAPTSLIPIVVDACGNPLTAKLTKTENNVIDGCGTIAYTYTFTDCANQTATWTYTYTVEPGTNFNVSTVETGDEVANLSDAKAPTTLPVVTDDCGRTLTPSAPVEKENMSGACGTKTYTYTYTNCANKTYEWVYTYIIAANIIQPDNDGKTVLCEKDAVVETIVPPVVGDGYGGSLAFSFKGKTGTYTDCEGTIIYTWTYVICEGEDGAADVTFDWTYTYTIDLTNQIAISEVTNSSTVSCEVDATEPTTLPVVTDACGRTLTPSEAMIGGTVTDGCGTKTYTYTYTDCANNAKTWTYTYSISPADDIDITDVSDGSTVSCEDDAVAPITLPIVTDACGRTLTPSDAERVSTVANGCGEVKYTYTYTDCAGNDATWTYTYNVAPEDNIQFSIPSGGGSEIDDADNAVAPTLPDATDDCGRELNPTGEPVVVKNMSGSCGSVTYTYTYEDCAGNDAVWTYAYTVNAGFEKPLNDGKTVACEEDAVKPAAPVVDDGYGGTLTLQNPEPVKGGTYVDCEGTITYTYTYLFCEDQTFEWTYTYTVEVEDFTMPANAGSPVSCEADAVVETIDLPEVKDNCGNILQPESTEPLKGGTGTSCDGTITYTWTYKDCEGNSHDWVYTYTVKDDTAPTFTLTDEIPDVIPAGNCEFTVPDLTSLVTNLDDNCTVTKDLKIIQTPAAGSPISKAATDITVTVTDACGNETKKTVTVNVPEDITPPVVSDVAPVFCEGAEVKLSDLVSLVTNPDAAKYDLLWYKGGNPVSDMTGALENGDVYSVSLKDKKTGCESAQVTINVTLQVCTDLVLTKAADAGTYCLNENVTFTLTLINNADIPAKAVSVTDLLPGEFTYISHSGGTYAGGIWTVGDMAANGASASLTITAKATTAGVGATNQAFVSSVNGDDYASYTAAPVSMRAQATVTINELPTATLTNPAAFCEGTLTAEPDKTIPGYTITWADGSAPTVAGLPATGSPYAYKYTVTDDATGCVGEEQTYTVTVNGNPTVAISGDTAACPSAEDITLTATASGGDGNYSYIWTNATAVEDTNTATASIPNLCNTSVNVTVTVTDGNTCEAISLVHTITVKDDEKPTFDLSEETVAAAATNCVFTVPDLSGLVINAADNCTAAGDLDITQTPLAGTEMTATGNVTITLTDACNNSTTKTVNVTVAAKPTVSIKNDSGVTQIDCTTENITLSVDNVTSDNPLDYLWSNNSTDNTSITVSEAGDYFLTVTDQITGCTAKSNVIEITKDESTPSVSIENITNTTNEINCTDGTITLESTVTSTNPVDYEWSNNATTEDITVSDGGTYTLTVTDRVTGCEVTSNAIVLDKDITLPVAGITNNSGTTSLDCNTTSISLTATGEGTYQWTTADGTITGASDVANLTVEKEGTYTVTVTGDNGCEDTESITIVFVPDTEKPVITDCHLDDLPAEFATEEGVTYATINLDDYKPTATDNCEVKSIEHDKGTQTQFPIGNTTITWTVTDTSGNTATCEQTITVKDTGVPEISCPPAITVECADEVPAPYADYAAFVAASGSATDNSGIDESSFRFVSDVSDNAFNPETITRTYEIADAEGNTSTCTQIITVKDTTKPEISTPEGSLDIELSCEQTDEIAAALLQTPSATDNCDGVMTVPTPNEVNTPDCGKAYELVRTWTFTDASGNESVFTQTITVTDKEAPKIDTPAGDLDRNLSCENTDDLADALALVPTATDNCDESVTAVLKSDNTVATDKGYTQTRTWTFTDDCGNESEVFTQVITVEDNSKPTITTPEGSLNADLSCEDTAELADALALEPEATDNCGTPTIVLVSDDTDTDPSCANAFVRTRVWKFTDAAGNESEVFTQTITVTDSEAPEITTPANSLDKALSCEDATGLAAALALAPEATDNCGTATVKTVTDNTVDDPSCPNAYVQTRTWTFVDECGNESEVFTQTITVTDDEAPVISTPANSLDKELSCEDATGLAAALALQPQATDNCSTATLLLVSDDKVTDVNCANAYVQTRVWNFKDACGNTTANFTQTITVTDEIAPQITTAAGSLDRNLSCEDATGLAAALALVPAATDNCSTPTIHLVSDNSDTVTGNDYVIIRVWNFTDDCGNTTADFTQKITVADTTPPTVPPIADVDALNDGGCNFSTPDLDAIVRAVSSDNCTLREDLVITYISGILTETGDVTVTVMDKSGNKTTVVVTVIVPDAISFTATDAAICKGESYNLMDAISDLKNGTIKFYTMPNGGGVEITSAVSPTLTTTYYALASNDEGCTLQKPIVITVNDKPTISVEASLEAVCEGSTLTLETPTVSSNLTVEDEGWLLDGVPFNPATKLTFADNGKTLVYFAENSCGRTESTVGVITVDKPVTFDTSADVDICYNEVATLSISNYPAGATITWTSDTGAMNHYGTDIISLRHTETTVYTITVENGACSLSKNITVNVTPEITFTVPEDYAICEGTEIELRATDLQPGVSVQWTSNVSGEILPAGAAITVTPASSRTYTATVSINGCSFSKTVEIQVDPKIIPSIVGNQIICYGEPVTLWASGGANYLWTSPASGVIMSPNEAETEAYLSETTVFTVEISRGACMETLSTTVTVLPPVEMADEPMWEKLNAVRILMKDSNEPAYQFKMDNGVYQSSNLFENLTEGLHTATARDKNGCTDRIQFKVVRLYIPPFFTPNDDEDHNEWVIEGIENFPNAEIDIYDRVGKHLATLPPTNPRWDGTANGYEMPSTDYWYRIFIPDTGEKFVGHFTLKR
jgi:gliding motility-associated-like protein/uncharacterized repeat protein (TIGR01451 family)